MANPEFVGLVTSVSATAEAALGQLNAATSSAARDGLLDEGRSVQVAERSLNLLLMLAEKTRGNLDFEEAEILTDAVASLRELLQARQEQVRPQASN
ncbi:DUF1844 domain-containing protein [Deinococcus radiophilus]|uniref:DUF1844 domain-containing protein n=1 Tax=Deinococcus radiophilus TaxID=32062 RepID=A0A3S0KHW5_9DEIO|nr:DUF1844 domain-containing protein [Deinococcus radiophilus]RTR30882.1 DUF1844 domain-containing protein [Deinococcus radiophilus]UFA49463.1 DUF1844 domain-containing protein [Deinococcus radiophilus]